MKKIRHGVLVGLRGVGAEAEIGTWQKSGCIAVRPSDGATSHYLISEAEFKKEFARKPLPRQLQKILENHELNFYRVVVGK